MTPYRGQIYSAGVRQLRIERLDGDGLIPVIPAKVARQGRRYGVGGDILPRPMNEMKPGESIALESTLDTTGYPPGNYALYIEYQDPAERKVRQTVKVTFELMDPATQK